MNYKLSICIPTYNRGDYIGDTLEKILSQNRAELQVIVSDNASIDNTDKIAEYYASKGLAIKYYKWPKNMGADENYLKSAQLADGEYIWFLGSDDWICPDAIDAIFKLLDSKSADIYLCSEYFCDLSMRPYSVHYLLGDDVPDRTFSFPARNELLEYFNLAQSHSALFGYLSSIIVAKRRWSAIKYDSRYTGTLYSHMFILYSIVAEGARLHYIATPLVMWRSGNDSFGGKGRITERYLVDINGFKMIIDDFFISDLEIVSAFTGAFRRHHPYKNIAYLRMHTPSQTKWLEIHRKLVSDFGYDDRILKLLGYWFSPYLLKIIFMLYRIKMKFSRFLSRLDPKAKYASLKHP